MRDAITEPGQAQLSERRTRALRQQTSELEQLVHRAGAGDRQAWEHLVAHYTNVIRTQTRQFGLGDSDAGDVAQTTWLRLVENIHRIEHPDRLSGWLATTARRECLRRLAASNRVVLVEDDGAFDAAVAHLPSADERLLATERAHQVREALAALPWRSRRMIELLMADPPDSYADISGQLGLPVGSIGPTRSRCLERLRGLLDMSLGSLPNLTSIFREARMVA